MIRDKVILFVTNKVLKIPGGLLECEIMPLIEMGFKIIWAANFSNCKFNRNKLPFETIDIPIRSNPLNLNNIKAFKILKKVIKRNNVYGIHCSTPIGGVLGRIAGMQCKVSKILYQVHGFLFFKHGPKLGFFYRFVEKILCRNCDCVVTINNEDFENAKKFKLRTKKSKIYLVHGSGMKLIFEKDSKKSQALLRTQLGISDDDYVVISIGELNKNKNVKCLIKAAKVINDKSIKFIICGIGKEEKKLKRMSFRYPNILFLGYQTNISSYLSISDLYVSCSFREGLSRTISEAMAIGVTCAVSNRRGQKDLIDNKNGYSFEPKDYKNLAMIIKLSKANKSEIHINQNKNIIKSYTADVVRNEMISIYKDIFL